MQELILRLMAEETKIRLTYEGPTVEDATFPVEEVIGALQGFSGAYNKIARLRPDAADHELRLSAINPGSFELVILAWIVLGQKPDAIQGLKVAYDATRWVVERIFKAIAIKKHTKNKPFEISVAGNNNSVVVVNADGNKLSIPVELVELFQQKALDSDLNKIVAPLEQNKVDSARLIAESEGQPLLQETIKSEEREYFEAITVETTKDAEIAGKFVSLNKESNRGTFELSNGKHVPYKYVGTHPDRFHVQFARKGPILAKGQVTFNDSLEPVQIEVHAVQHVQGSLLDQDSE